MMKESTCEIKGELLAKVFTRLKAGAPRAPRLGGDIACPVCAVNHCRHLLYDAAIEMKGDFEDEIAGFFAGLVIGAAFALDALGVEHEHPNFSMYEIVNMDS